MGRRSRSARTKSSTPSPVGAPPKRPKTTTLHHFWSQSAPSTPTTPIVDNRRSKSQSPATSKFSSPNRYAVLDDEPSPQEAQSSQGTPRPQLSSASSPSQDARPIIPQRRLSPGSSHLARPLPVLPVPESPDKKNSSKAERVDDRSTSPPSSSEYLGSPYSLTPPDTPQRELADTGLVIDTTPENKAVVFTEETPSPTTTESIRQSASGIARRLRYIDDDDSETGLSPGLSTAETRISQPTATLKNILRIGTAYSPSSNMPHPAHYQSTHTATSSNNSGHLIDRDTHPPNIQTTESAFKLPPPPPSESTQYQAEFPPIEKATNLPLRNQKLPLVPPKPNEEVDTIHAKRTTAGKSIPAEPMQIDQTTASSESSAATGPPSAKNPPVRKGDKKVAPPRLKQPRPTELRFDVKITIPPSEAADVALIAGITKLFARLKTSDPTVVIYPWHNEHVPGAPTIVDTKLIPTSLSTLKKYFPRLNPRAMGGEYFTTVRLGFSESLDGLVENNAWWFQEQKISMWPRPLQCEETTVLGWLLYSVREMDIKSLTTVLSDSSGIDFGLRWQTITLGQKGPISEENKIRAIHVEVDTCDAASAKRWLERTYGTRTLGPFPHGIKMRLVPELTPLTNTQSRVKIERLRARQARFCKKVVRTRTWELTSLDYVSPDVGHSLRQLMMEIKSKEKPVLPLFHSVDLQWRGDGHVVTYLPEFESEARMMLIGLLTYLNFHHPDKAEALETYFSDSAVERAVETKWDPDQYCMISADDERVDALVDADLDYDLLDSDDDENTAKAVSGTGQQVPAPQRPDATNLQSRTLYGKDDDSVSTFASTRTGQSRKKRVNFAPTPSASDTTGHKSSTSTMQDEQQSTVSSISQQTLEERFQNIELLVNDKIAETNHILRLLLARQDAVENHQSHSNQDTPTRQSVVSPTGEASIPPRDTGGGL